MEHHGSQSLHLHFQARMVEQRLLATNIHTHITTMLMQAHRLKLSLHSKMVTLEQ